MSDSKETSIKVIYFSGKADDFLIWITKFKAKCLQSKRLAYLTGATAIPTQAAYLVAEAVDEAARDAAQAQVVLDYERSLALFASMILSMDTRTDDGRVAFEAVNESKTVDNPDGDARMAYETLVQKYEARTAPNYLKLNAEFTNSKLESDEDEPDKWITHLQSLRSRMNEVVIVGKSDKTEMDMILHILSAVP